MRRRLVPLALVALVGAGAAMIACAADESDPSLSPQPLPPDDRKAGDPPPSPEQADNGASSGSGGTGAPAFDGDAGADGGDGG